MDLFGFQITRKPSNSAPPRTPVTPMVNGSAILQTSGAMGSFCSYAFDIEGIIKSEIDLINRYREVATYPICEQAIEQIVNDMVVLDQVDAPVIINTDNIKKRAVARKIEEAFQHVCKVLDFDRQCHDIVKRWYIDGQLYYYITVDPKHPKNGIQAVTYVDPRKIKKVTEIEKEKDQATGVEIVKSKKEFFLFNDNGLMNAQQGVKLSPESVVYVKSGLVDANSGNVISHLYQAIKPVNQLKMMEDAVVIYRITRAPERRIFYIDVGNMQPQRAEQYVASMMNKFRNKIQYNVTTGEVSENKHYQSILEDYWLPRREGGRGTQVEALPAGCLAMDTKVSLLDGRSLTIREIESELKSGKTLWTYSCDPITGKIVPGLISWAGVTQKSAKVMRITLDNGETITCTPDHKFPIKGIGFKRADELKVNDSLIPLYKRTEPIGTRTLDYEQIFDNEERKWKFTHRVVANYIDPVRIDDQVIHHVDFNRFNNAPENLRKMNRVEHFRLHSKLGKKVLRDNYNHAIEQGGPTGYSDKCRNIFNNWKSSLTKAEWQQYLDNCNWVAKLSPEEFEQFRKNCAKTSNAFWQNMTQQEYIDFCAKVSSSLTAFFASQTDEEREKWAVHCQENFKKAREKSKWLHENDPEWSRWNNQVHSECWTQEMREERSKLMSQINRQRWNDPVLGENLRQKHRAKQQVVITDDIAKFVIDLVKDKTCFQMTVDNVCKQLNANHVLLDQFIEVNKDKSIPNFFGMFTPNLIQKAVPRHLGFKNWREFRKNCHLVNHRIVAIELLPDEIEVGTLTIDQDEIFHGYHTFALACGVFTKNSSLDQIEDVIFFQKKLYASMHVPLQRLMPENNFTLGRSQELTREEIIFAKFIQRLRNNFADLFRDLLKVQLLAAGVCRPNEADQLIKQCKFVFTNDNYFEQLKRMELMTEKFNVVSTADAYVGKYVSKNWIAKNIFLYTDAEWEEIQKEAEVDKKEEQEEMNADGDFGGGDNFEPAGEEAPDAEEPQYEEEPSEQEPAEEDEEEVTEEEPEEEAEEEPSDEEDEETDEESDEEEEEEEEDERPRRRRK